MERTVGLLATGAALVIAGFAGRWSSARAAQVPRMARRIGETNSLREWKHREKRGNSAMVAIGTLLVIGGVLSGAVALLQWP